MIANALTAPQYSNKQFNTPNLSLLWLAPLLIMYETVKHLKPNSEHLMNLISFCALKFLTCTSC